MKIQSKLFLIGSAAVLSASLLATAAEPAVSQEVPRCSAEAVEADHAGEEVTAGEKTGDTEVTHCEKDVDGEVTDPDADLVVRDGEDSVATLNDSGVPIDWVKRDGGDNPEILSNMAGGDGPAIEKAEASSVLSRELGQDDKAAAIEAKGNSVTPLIKGVKKETQALVKKGRVFLR